jgi:uncharacterized protein (UPF0335 family)
LTLTEAEAKEGNQRGPVEPSIPRLEFSMEDVNPATAGQLKAFIERIERLEEEKRQIAEDVKDVYAEAKANGFDVKILRKIIALRRQDADERREQEEILETYLRALGMQ